MDALNELLVSAITDCLKRVVPDDLVGFALIVDADMQSVYGASADRRSIDENEGVDFIYTPVDWSVEHHTEGFRWASERLSQMTSGNRDSAYAIRVCDVMDRLGKALEHARALMPSIERTLLLVACADGGGPWHSAEGDCVRRLNGPTAYEQWRSVHGGDV